MREMTCVGFLIVLSQAAKENLSACKYAQTVISLRSIAKGFWVSFSSSSFSPLFFSVPQ